MFPGMQEGSEVGCIAHSAKKRIQNRGCSSFVALIRDSDISAGFLFFSMLVATSVFGRLYCSFLCPLGAFQDILIGLSTRAGIVKRHAFQKPYPAVRYALAVSTLVAFAAGFLSLLSLLDPYSIFGRITSGSLKSITLEINNVVVHLLERFDIYAVRPRRQHLVPFGLAISSAVLFCIIAGFSVAAGRSYCNTVCPVGTLLGTISRFFPSGFRIDPKKCNSCGLCERVCPAGCIDSSEKSLDASRCVGGFNCVSACGKNAAKYSVLRMDFARKKTAPSRRAFLLSGLAAAGAVATAGASNSVGFRQLAFARNLPLAPPGSTGTKRFASKCIGCLLCAGVCPTKVLVPGGFADSIFGFSRPELNYREGHCDFECNACGMVCPTGAISAVPLEEKKLIRIGQVFLDKRRCILHVKKKHCGACGEVCSTHAIFPVQKGLALIPEIEPDCCIGCGACELACPTKPKAIFVNAKPVHEKARKWIPEPLKFDGGLPSKESFPF